MKNRNCPNKDMCWDYKASNCDGCAIGEKIARLARQNKKLKAENVELRARLEKAVELPCIEPMTTWDWNEETGIAEKHFGDYYQLLYRDEDGEFICTPGLKKEEAEARLKEIKEEI